MSRLERMLKEEGTVIRSTVDFTSLSFRCIATHEYEYLFLQSGADPNATAVGGVTPLHIAADHGDERMVDCLLAAGANPDAVDDVRSLFFPCFKLPLSTYLWHPVLSLYASSIFLFI
jgi:hypothetical protein